MSTTRTLTIALALPLVLLGHEVGYRLAGEHGTGHGHLAVLVEIVFVSVLGASVLAMAGLWRRAPVRLSTRTLLVHQVVAYLALEVVERLLADAGPSLVSVPVALGLLAQVPLALAAARLARSSATVLRRLVDLSRATPPPPPPRRSARQATAPVVPDSRLHDHATAPRGPPVSARSPR